MTEVGRFFSSILQRIMTSNPSLIAGNLFGVDGLVAVITGGGTGIGAMMTTALAENGAARIYIIGRRIEKLQEMAAKYPE